MFPSLVASVCTSPVPILPIGCAYPMKSCQCQCAKNVSIVCQSFPSQGVPRLQKLSMSRYIYRPSCPCQCTPCVQNLLCQGAIVWLRFPLCGTLGGYHVVTLCAKFPISWSHRVPTLPFARCHRVPMFPMSRCHRVLLSLVACAPCCAQSCPSH